jgi:hypothetical protein
MKSISRGSLLGSISHRVIPFGSISHCVIRHPSIALTSIDFVRQSYTLYCFRSKPTKLEDHGGVLTHSFVQQHILALNRGLHFDSNPSAAGIEHATLKLSSAAVHEASAAHWGSLLGSISHRVIVLGSHCVIQHPPIALTSINFIHFTVFDPSQRNLKTTVGSSLARSFNNAS